MVFKKTGDAQPIGKPVEAKDLKKSKPAPKKDK